MGPPQLTDTWMSRDGHRVLLPAIMVESLVIEPVPQEFNSLVSNSAAFRRVTLKLKIAPRTRVLRLKLRTFDASGSVLSEQFLHLPAGSKETSTYIGSRTEVSKAVVAPADRLGDAPWSLLPSEEFPAAGADTPAEQADAEPSAPVSAAVHQARSLLAFALAAATLRETSESYDTASVVLDHYIHVTA